MDNNSQSLWLSALRGCFADWRVWIRWALGFAAISAIFSILTFDPEMMQATYKLEALQATKDKEAITAQMQTLSGILTRDVWIYLITFLIFAAQNFCCMTLFLQQEPVIGKPVMSVPRLIYTEWNRFQVFLIMVGLAIACGLIVFIAWKLFVPAGIIMAIVCYGFFIYAILKFYLVMPMAICDIESPIKSSWKLTDGKWWRLFGNTLLYVLIIMGFYCALARIEQLIINQLAAAYPGDFFSPPDVSTLHGGGIVGRFISLAPNHPFSLPVGKIMGVFPAINGSLMLIFLGYYRSTALRIFSRGRE